MNAHDLQKLSDSLIVYVKLSEPIIDYTSIPSGIFLIVDFPEGHLNIPLNDPSIFSIVEATLFPSHRKTMVWDIKQLSFVG